MTRRACRALFTRGVLLDVAGHRGVDCLPAGSPVDAAEIEAVATAQDVQLREWDVVLVRTGYMGLWPDAERMARHTSPGPDLSAAELLADAGVVAVGSDTETFEVQPAPDPGAPSNPQPVHTRLLVERGIYLMESLISSSWPPTACTSSCSSPSRSRSPGATGSMIDPLAVV